jgi:hypothetical protein
MHYVTRRFHQMQKHMFGIMCPVRTGMHYVTRISNRMQKYNFSETYPIAFFMETAQGPPEHEN